MTVSFSSPEANPTFNVNIIQGKITFVMAHACLVRRKHFSTVSTLVHSQSHDLYFPVLHHASFPLPLRDRGSHVPGSYDPVSCLLIVGRIIAR